MQEHPSSGPSPASVLKGTVYGDLVGSPYMTENTYNRYFDLGEGRRAYSRGRVRTFFPSATEVSHGAAAVCAWLSTHREDPTAEALQACLRRQYEAHPRGGWTEGTRLFLTSGTGEPSSTPDWSALTRAIPIAALCGGDFFTELDLAEACVRATCSDEDTVRMARAITHAVHMALEGRDRAEIFTVMEMQYGLVMTRPEEDMRAELRGEVPEPLTILGQDVDGAYRYRMPDAPVPPSSRLVAEAALRSVLRSDSWEDAVRRAVSMGGPSNAVAGIAGGLAEALYGEVTPSVIGKLFTYVPMDIGRQIDSMERAAAPRVTLNGSPYGGIARDAVTLIGTGPGQSVYVVSEDRREVRSLLERTIPNVKILPPEGMQPYLDSFRDDRQGTYPYGPRPEVRTLYVQDGARLVSPSAYIAPGMPPLQERRRHQKEFLSLRLWCIGVQRELNALAGNAGAGQVHYGNAYHLWIGSRRIDFLFGDALAGRVSLGERGLLKVDLGEYRDLPANARFEGYREAAWATRSLFTSREVMDPLSHLDDIRRDIRARLLDEGLGAAPHPDGDRRSLSEEELRDRTPVSNIDHLEPLPEGSGTGMQAYEGVASAGHPADRAEERRQPVKKIYTIGYGTRSREAFINALKMIGTDTVVDVRGTPSSRFAPQFDADALFQALQNEGMGYFFAGEKLGGRADWEALRNGADYREGIAAVERLAAEGAVVAITGAEADPLQSHRFGTVARDLALDGMDVHHVLPNGEVASHAQMESRMVARYAERGLIPSGLTGSYQDQLRECYHILGRERAYKPGRRPRYQKVKF